MKVPAIEKLARRICWLGFPRPIGPGWTETGYWRSLPEQTRDKYREEARWLCWAVGKLDDSGSGWHLMQTAIAERSAA